MGLHGLAEHAFPEPEILFISTTCVFQEGVLILRRVGYIGFRALKKNSQDCHRFGKGKIFIDRTVVEEYLAFRGIDQLDPQKYELVDIVETKPPADFYHFHNKTGANGLTPYENKGSQSTE